MKYEYIVLKVTNKQAGRSRGRRQEHDTTCSSRLTGRLEGHGSMSGKFPQRLHSGSTIGLAYVYFSKSLGRCFPIEFGSGGCNRIKPFRHADNAYPCFGEFSLVHTMVHPDLQFFFLSTVAQYIGLYIIPYPACLPACLPWYLPALSPSKVVKFKDVTLLSQRL